MAVARQAPGRAARSTTSANQGQRRRVVDVYTAEGLSSACALTSALDEVGRLLLKGPAFSFPDPMLPLPFQVKCANSAFDLGAITCGHKGYAGRVGGGDAP